MNKSAKSWLAPMAVMSVLALAGSGEALAQKGKPGGGGGGETGLSKSLISRVAIDQGLRIQGDDQGDYVDGTESVVSIIQRNPEEYELSTASSATRAIFVDFGAKIRDGYHGGAPFDTGLVKGRFVSKCFQLGTGSVGTMNGVGSTLECPLPFVFDYNGSQWQLRMNSANEPGTDNAIFTCTAAASSGQCTAWSVAPGGVDGRNVARLIRIPLKGKTVHYDHGEYYITFSLEAQRR